MISIRSLVLVLATFLPILSSTLLSDDQTADAPVYPKNNGFETPDKGFGEKAWGWPGSDHDWIFGYSGIAANGALGLTGEAVNGNSDGTTSTAGQSAYIGGGHPSDGEKMPGFISQELTLPDGIATVTFTMKAKSLDNLNAVKVFLGPANQNLKLVGVFSPTSDSEFTKFTTNPTRVSAGVYRLTMMGTVEGTDAPITFVDDVKITFE